MEASELLVCQDVCTSTGISTATAFDAVMLPTAAAICGPHTHTLSNEHSLLASGEQQWDENLQIEFAVSCQDGWLTQMTSCPASAALRRLLSLGGN